MPKSILGWFWRYCTHADSFISLVPLAFLLGEFPSKPISERYAFCADMSVSLQLVKDVSVAAGIVGTQKLKCPRAVELNTLGRDFSELVLIGC